MFCFFACLLLIRLLFDNCLLVDSIFCLLLPPSRISPPVSGPLSSQVSCLLDLFGTYLFSPRPSVQSQLQSCLVEPGVHAGWNTTEDNGAPFPRDCQVASSSAEIARAPLLSMVSRDLIR